MVMILDRLSDDIQNICKENCQPPPCVPVIVWDEPLLSYLPKHMMIMRIKCEIGRKLAKLVKNGVET